MYSKILTKLISESITPFFGFVFLKSVVTILSARSLNLNIDLFTIFNLAVSKENYLIINSNVLFSFVVFSFLGLAYSLIKSIYFHDSHINPRLSLSVFNFRVGFLIQDSFHLFSQSIIWLFFNFITFFMTIFLFSLGLTQGFLVIVSGIFCLIGTYFFVLDIEYELNKTIETESEEIFVS